MGIASESGGPVPYPVDPSSILVPPIDEHDLHGTWDLICQSPAFLGGILRFPFLHLHDQVAEGEHVKQKSQGQSRRIANSPGGESKE